MATKLHGGLSAFLNENSQQSSTLEHVNTIQRIPIEDIQNNAKNFYGLRDVDGLANTIALTKIVEPLIVTENPKADEGEGKYLLISGHRRKAAWQILLNDGRTTDHTLPCIVRRFEPRVITMEDGTEKEISAERMAEAFLMFSNMGQRKVRTIDEKLHEVEALEPLARDLYASKDLVDGRRGDFRPFFATQILGIGSGTLQRLLSLRKLTERVKTAIDEGDISVSLGAQLASLSPEAQDEWMDKIASGEVKGTFAAIAEYKKSLKEDEAPDGDDAGTEETEPADDAPGTEDEPPADTEPADTDNEPEDDDDHPNFPSDIPDDVTEDEPDYTEPADDDIEPEDDDPLATIHAVSQKQVDPNDLMVPIADVPKNIHSKDFKPQEESTDWRKEQMLSFIDRTIEYCQQKIEETADDELISAQWNLRKSAMQVERIMQMNKK